MCVCVLCIRILRGKCHTCTFYVQYCVCCMCIYVNVCRCKHVQRPGEDIEFSALLLHLIPFRQVLLLHLDLVRQPTCLLVSAHVCWYVWKYKVDNGHLFLIAFRCIEVLRQVVFCWTQSLPILANLAILFALVGHLYWNARITGSNLSSRLLYECWGSKLVSTSFYQDISPAC